MGSKVLLLIGSPRGQNSTSNVLGGYVVRGRDAKKLWIYPLLRSDEGRKKLLSAIDESNSIVLAFPLYVDSLPAPVIEMMELMSGRKNNNQKFYVICNCGFPESFHINTAIRICEKFAKEAGFEWGGGLKMGMGAMIDGQQLQKFGMMTKHVIKALDAAAVSISKSEMIGDEAQKLLDKNPIPKWIYLFFANRAWVSLAKKNKVQKQLDNKPYQI